MKYQGKVIKGVHTDFLVLRDKTPNRIVFYASAVVNYDAFDTIVTSPIPPTITRKGGISEADINDATYIKNIQDYATKKSDWTVLQSLLATEDLEWETVDMSKPSTWGNWRTELTAASFCEQEKVLILQLVMRVNSMDQSMLSEARTAFLREARLAKV